MDDKDVKAEFRALLFDIKRIFGNRALFNSADLVRKQSAILWKNVQDDQAFEAYQAATGNLENHFSQCSKKATAAVDDLLIKVPSTTYARLKFMELLAGVPVALGSSVDLSQRANQLSEELKAYFRREGWEDENGNPMPYDTPVPEEEIDWDEIRKEDLIRWNISKIPLHFHLLVVLQHLNDAGLIWAKGSVNPPRPTVKKSKGKLPLNTLALFYGLRYLSNDPNADMDLDRAKEIGAAEGYTAASSGKDLKDHFTRYTMGPNRQIERIKDGQPHTVRARYRSVMAMLTKYPEALKIAQADLEKVKGGHPE